ncbi:MAG: amidohydrolase [Nocardioides sp.]|nr:amidohydrolase [Nocardioides sp.]
MLPSTAVSVAALLQRVPAYAEELVAFRRDLHAYPELAWHETRTIERVATRLRAAGLEGRRLPRGGLVVDVGSGGGPLVALRADLDALPIEDETDDPWRSTVPGVAHGCGHDVHTSALLGSGLLLAELGDQLPGRVRLLFQPAEEVMPGGALELLAAGALDGVESVFGLHCDPGLDVGEVGVREGPLTGAADALDVSLSGAGGHTSRPHLTQDLTYALGKLVTDLPGALSRRLDPRAGASVVWGEVRAGSAINVIPASGRARGTVRMLDAVAWGEAEGLVRELVEQVVRPYGVHADVTYVRGVPPVVNDAAATVVLTEAARTVVGAERVVTVPQSLGGEDFAWYLEQVPGSMARLGTRAPGGPTYDLHQGDLRVDDGAVGAGAAVLAVAALGALAELRRRDVTDA